MADLRNALANALNQVERGIADGAFEWDRMSPSERRNALFLALDQLMSERGRILRLEDSLPAEIAAGSDPLTRLEAIAKRNEEIAAEMPNITQMLEKVTALLGQARKITSTLKKAGA